MQKYFHWCDASNGTRLVLKESTRKQLLKEAIARFGKPSDLSKETKLCKQTIFNYLYGVSMTVGGLKKILDVLRYKYKSIEKDITELSWCKNITLPVNLSSPIVATLAAAILGDGTLINPQYKNSDVELIEKVKEATGEIFGDIVVNNRISKQGIPFIELPRLLKHVLLYLGISTGRQTFTNPCVPEQIRTGPKETQKAFLQQFFDDEGSVERNYRRLSVSQAVACTDKIPKAYYSSMEIRKAYYIKDMPTKTKSHLVAPRILIDIRVMLKSTFDIDSVLQLKRIGRQQSGHVSAYWEVVINKHVSVKRFRDKIGFHCSRKQEALEFTLNRNYSLPQNANCLLINKALELAKEKDNFTSADLAHSLNFPPRQVKKKMITLVRHGIFSKIKKGTYIINIRV